MQTKTKQKNNAFTTAIDDQNKTRRTDNSASNIASYRAIVFKSAYDFVAMLFSNCRSMSSSERTTASTFAVENRRSYIDTSCIAVGVNRFDVVVGINFVVVVVVLVFRLRFHF
jgi:hypothetical protein